MVFITVCPLIKQFNLSPQDNLLLRSSVHFSSTKSKVKDNIGFSVLTMIPDHSCIVPTFIVQ